MSGILLFFSVLYSRAQPQEIYLLFKKDSVGSCNFSMYRDGAQKAKHAFVCKKDVYGGKVCFGMCKQKFESSFVESEMISAKEVERLTFSDIDTMLNVIEADWPNVNKANAYKVIYVLEKEGRDYRKHKVKWLED